jgi:hypothetical protein
MREEVDAELDGEDGGEEVVAHVQALPECCLVAVAVVEQVDILRLDEVDAEILRETRTE